jgi:hypothetical protein
VKKYEHQVEKAGNQNSERNQLSLAAYDMMDGVGEKGIEN